MGIESGLVDARLGGFLVKKRIAGFGRGKSGGYRTIIAHRQGDRVVFVHGFPRMRKTTFRRERGERFVSWAITT